MARRERTKNHDRHSSSRSDDAAEQELNAAMFMMKIDEERRRYRGKHRRSRSDGSVSAEGAGGDTQADIEVYAAYDDLCSDDDDEDEAPKKKILSMAKSGDSSGIIRVLNSNPSLMTQATNSAGDTVLHIAAKYGHEDTVQSLVRFRNKHKDMTRRSLMSLSEVNNSGNTPLHLALLEQAHTRVASYLIRKEPEAAYVLNNDGVSPLYLAVESGHRRLVKELFDVLPGSRVTDYQKRKLLQSKGASIAHAAVDQNDLGLLELLLRNLEILKKSTNEDGWKPISYAAYKGNHEQVLYFLDIFPKYAGRIDKDGSYPIHKAAMGGSVRTLEMFISYCPKSIALKSHSRETVLHFAAKCQKKRIIRFLETQHNEDYLDIANDKDDEGM